LVDDARWRRLQDKELQIARVMQLLEIARSKDVPLVRLLRRPSVTWHELAAEVPELAAVPAEVTRQVMYDARYAGYIAREDVQIDRQRRLVERRIPEDFDFWSVDHMRTEAREKLARIRPLNLAQAGRISGITPADLAVLMVHLDGRRGQPSQSETA
jgi:tRNA uridine 5-carboxymethylaminomethyl modification enzyme